MKSTEHNHNPTQRLIRAACLGTEKAGKTDKPEKTEKN